MPQPAIVGVLALLMAGLVLAFLRDRPSDHGLLPYGMEPGSVVVEAERTGASPARVAVDVLRKASRRWSFWALVLTFWVCGWSTNGIIQTHFVPAAHDHGMPSTTAAGLLAVVGIFDIAGTVASGWLTDRVDPRWLLVAYYGGRGISLLALDAVLAPGIEPGMWVFIVFYGLDWVATVPPTVALCRTHFGLADSGVVFGWVFASHMVGAGVGASVAGWVRTSQGDYHWAWVVAAALCFASVAITLSIPKVREGTTAELERVSRSADPGDDAGREGVQRGLGVAVGQRGEHVLRLARHGVRVLAGHAHGPVCAQQAERLGEARVVLEVAGEQLLQAGVGRVGRGEHVQDGQGALALTQVGAGRLAGLVGLGLDVDEVVGELEGDAEPLAELAHGLDGGVVAAGEHRAVARGGGDEHAGLVGEHREVVVDRVGAGAGRAGRRGSGPSTAARRSAPGS